MRYADDSDFPTQSQVKSNEMKTKTNNILSRHSLKMRKYNKWENATIKLGKNRPEEMEWWNAEKLESIRILWRIEEKDTIVNQHNGINE